SFSVVIEEWATHTVVRHIHSRKLEVIYGPWKDRPVWTHVLPKKDGDRWSEPRLEVALSYDFLIGGFLNLWARGGRFTPRGPFYDEVRDDAIFLRIPLTEKAGLEKYYVDPNADTTEEYLKDIEYVSGSDRYYRHEESHMRWGLRVHDFAAGAREALRSRL